MCKRRDIFISKCPKDAICVTSNCNLSPSITFISLSRLLFIIIIIYY